MSEIKGSYQDIAERYLLKPLDTINRLKNGEKVNSIPFEILRRIIEDDEYYNYAMKTFEHDFFFRMGVPRGKEITNIMVFEKQDILDALAELLNSRRILVTERAIERFDNLCNANTISIDELRKTHTGSFTVIKNEKEYEIKYNDLFDIMDSYINHDEEIIEELSFDKEYRDVLCETAQLLSQKLIKDRNGTIARIKINPKLREKIFEDMPDDFSILERAIFIYIKLSKELTYSTEYEIFWEIPEVANKYMSLDQIQSITPENNEVVCYQIEMMYLRFLGELGVGLDKDDIYINDHKYGEEHIALFFLINDFFLYADHVEGRTDNDLTGIKINSEITGLKRICKNEQEENEFKIVLDRVYGIIQEKEMAKEESKHRLEDYKKAYEALTNNLWPVSLDERTNTLVDAINSANLKWLDAIGSIILLKKKVFTEEQNEKNVNMTIVRNLDTNYIRKKGMPSLVISINPVGFEESPDSTTYYLYNPGQPLEKISKEKLQIKCGIGTISYINEKRQIPGIKDQDMKWERLGYDRSA